MLHIPLHIWINLFVLAAGLGVTIIGLAATSKADAKHNAKAFKPTPT